MVAGVVALELGGGFGCEFVHSLCWPGRIVLKKLGRERLLGLLLLRRLIEFGLWLRR